MSTGEGSQSRIENYRREIPKTVTAMTQVVVDNPGQFALMTAGAFVIGSAARNIVKPKSAVEALALAVVLQVGLPALAVRAAERGWIKLRVRDQHGCLIPLAVENDPGEHSA